MSPQDGGDRQRAVLLSAPHFTGERLTEELASNIQGRDKIVNPAGNVGVDVGQMRTICNETKSAKYYLSSPMSE